MTAAGKSIDRLAVSTGASTTKLMTTAEKNGLRVSKVVNAEAGAMGNLSKAALTAEKSVGGAFGRMARYAKTGIVFGLAASLYIGIEKMKEHAAVAAETEHFIQKLGNAHYTSAKKVEDFANHLSSLSGIEDDTIQHASNILLTFRGVAGILDRATTAAVDMSHTFGQDAAKSAVQLGKALFDPVKGATALRRIGISLSQSQKDLIKSLEETGQHAKAQEIILKEVEAEVGGAAEAYGKTLPGMIGRAKHAFEQFSEVLTRAVAPSFNVALGGLAKLFGLMSRHATTVKVLAGVLGSLAAAWAVGRLLVFVQGLSLWGKAMGIVTTATKVLRGEQTLLNAVIGANPYVRIAQILVLLGIAVVALYKKWKPFHDFVVGSWRLIEKVTATSVAAIIETVKGMAYLMLKWFTMGIRGILGLASHLPLIGGRFKSVLKSINGFVDQFKPDFGKVTQTWEAGGEQGGKAYGKGVEKGVRASGPAVARAAQDVTSQAFRDAHPDASTIAANAKAAIDAALPDLMSKAQEVIDKMTERMKARLDAARSTFQAAFSRLADLGLKAFDAKTQAALDKFQRQVDAALAKIGAQGAALTPAEAKLKSMEDAKAEQDRQQALADARGQLATAVQSGDPAAVAQAKKAVADAEYQIQIAALQKQAEAERAARDRQTAERQAAYQAEADQIRKNYESQRELQRYHLEQWLQQWEAYLQAHPKQWRRAWAAISRVLGQEWGPGMRAAAKNLGLGFQTSIQEAIQKATRAAFRLQAVAAQAQNFGRGLANGILAGLGALEINLYYTLYNQIVAALNKARKTFGIHSPSTWTQKHIGEPLGQGVVAGFENSTNNMRVAIEALKRGQGSSTMATSVVQPGLRPNREGPMSGNLGKQITVVQHITQTDPDPHQTLRQAKFAADAVFA